MFVVKVKFIWVAFIRSRFYLSDGGLNIQIVNFVLRNNSYHFCILAQLIEPMSKSNLSRRVFFKSAFGAASLLLFGIWDRMVKNEGLSAVKKLWRIPFNRNRKVSFVDEYIVVNNANKTNVFSSHCTHLGCNIHEFKEGKFVCPCHGSEFSPDGEVTKGPAYKPLEKIDFNIDEKEGVIYIDG